VTLCSAVDAVSSPGEHKGCAEGSLKLCESAAKKSCERGLNHEYEWVIKRMFIKERELHRNVKRGVEDEDGTVTCDWVIHF
jgi:hypothetical protein